MAGNIQRKWGWITLLRGVMKMEDDSYAISKPMVYQPGEGKDFTRITNVNVDLTPNCPYADRAIGGVQCCNEKLCPYEKMSGRITQLVDGLSCKIGEFEEMVLKGEEDAK